MRQSLCDGWEFTPRWSEDFLRGGAPGAPVRLPHTVCELPLHYAVNEDYERICGYRRKLRLGPEHADKRLFLQFDGAAHIAQVYVNGALAGEHRGGYTAFRVEITALVRAGENDIAVRLDCTENPAVPPFGFVIDYLTYGGLYREAWLDIRPKVYIEDVFVTTPALDLVRVAITCDGAPRARAIRLYDPDGELCAEAADCGAVTELRLERARLWSCETPNLYRCEVTADDDTVSTTFGVRTAAFRADGFYLNGKKTFLRGLNRHQCWPYIGYAAPASLQREDARILKEELGVNAVRTAHYPQSRHFIEACDRLGLCVFTELPGWQHIGGAQWQDTACENVREMVLQYRNHPSIVLWGVRINESVDNDALYERTNAIAHALDPTRATSGVRYLEKSSLLEDVYAFNDFSHNGTNGGARPKEKVTPDARKAFLISEHNGHMFPTKAFDSWEKRQEHALRHARVLDAAMASGVHAGCFGWCMFDYATHRDFGSGDRMCYHGVLDAFRNPKLAAALYQSQQEDEPVLEVGSSFDIGDYSAGQPGTVYVFTNADAVRLYKNDRYVTEFVPSGWDGLPHGPIAVDDTIGALLRTQEGFTGAKERLLHESLTAAGKYGLSNLPALAKLKMGWCMLRYRLSYADGVALYGKYIGNWGGAATRWRFDAVKDGEVIKSVTRCPGGRLHLEVRSSAGTLREGDTYDMAALRVRVLDEHGNVASYAQLPVRFSAAGAVELIGPGTAAAEGGMCGAYVRTVGAPGEGTVTVRAPGLEPVTVSLKIELQEERSA